MTLPSPLDVATFTSLFAVGWFAWTIGEYVLHRFAMHEMRGRGIASREHLRHHGSRDSVLEGWVLSWLGIAVTGAAFGWLLAVPFGLGWVVGYAFYDVQHYLAHRRAPRTRYQRWLRRHHFHHHFGHPMANHGVTWALWDRAFGTYERPGRVRVPRRMAMVWLLDDAGEVRPEHRDTYEVAGRRPESSEQAAADLADAFANRAPAL